ncbi:MAG: DUF2283 domain-containing protein [Prochlorotrichaceae cyanobacterium]
MMQIRYFPETDTLVIELSSRSSTYTEAVTENLILDYDDQDQVIAITIDHYSRNVYRSELEVLTMPLCPVQTA